MSVRIVRLKDGDDIICDLYEVMTDDEKRTPVGYQLNHPFSIWMKDGIDPMEDAEGEEDLEPGEGMMMKISEPEIGFNPWTPLNKNDKVLIKTDDVITIYETYDEVVEKYNELVEATNGGGPAGDQLTYRENPDDDDEE